LFGDDGTGIHAVRKLKQEFGFKIISKIKIIAVEAKNLYNLGEELTKEMKNAIPAIMKKVKEILKK
jgi:Ni,Fe-hydrogenase maturation factor